ncbi:MAG: hypothetical protein DWB56_09775 [Candidatus Jettenia sp.]|uniref:Uncharacterized protein n=1 Tax=Candidatus Jettenia caeni TaxID=247490 RepID=I3II77_9BACT|nr:MAG: hypothetical protein EDM77_03105 [Candidatus Jettenia sp. AMX1]MBC6929235.1 hypothetical protein [Candidatus Jettenia sp.]MCE7880204.1 hypothetical protein [Candidatus Jettenia sp. AMX1]MCQ3926372.1 hypothetical protein [Candidatus Jettenia sp.]GAB61422.1 hypothetical protein KSU1_B0565 [Candidatus Jettenia caeni]
MSHDTKASSFVGTPIPIHKLGEMMQVKYHVGRQKVHETHQRYSVFLPYKTLEIPASLLDNCFVTSV